MVMRKYISNIYRYVCFFPPSPLSLSFFLLEELKKESCADNFLRPRTPTRHLDSVTSSLYHPRDLYEGEVVPLTDPGPTAVQQPRTFDPELTSYLRRTISDFNFLIMPRL